MLTINGQVKFILTYTKQYFIKKQIKTNTPSRLLYHDQKQYEQCPLLETLPISTEQVESMWAVGLIANRELSRLECYLQKKYEIRIYMPLII